MKSASILLVCLAALALHAHAYELLCQPESCTPCLPPAPPEPTGYSKRSAQLRCVPCAPECESGTPVSQCNSVSPTNYALEAQQVIVFNSCAPCPSVQDITVVISGDAVLVSGPDASGSCNFQVTIKRRGSSKREPESGSVCIPEIGLCSNFFTRGVGAGDPHILGIQQQRFDFDGEIGSVYNMVSESHVQVNALLGPYNQLYHLRNAGTWMTELCASVKDRSGAVHTVTVQAGSRGSFTDEPVLFIDAQRVPFQVEGNTAFNGVQVAWRVVDGDATEHGSVWEGRAIRVIDIEVEGHLSLHMLALEDGKVDGQWHAIPHRYLDLTVLELTPGLSMHGVIGQTNKPTNGVDEFVLEGTEADYLVHDGVCGTDSRFSLFDQ